HSEIPSPFASSLMFEFTGAMLYGGDQPRAEWRTQLLAIDRETLSTLIRPEEMRGLIDRRAVSGLEAVLQRMAERSKPRSPDELAHRYGVARDVAAARLQALQALGEVVAGEFLPGGTEREFVDAQNLRRIHQETLRILRKQIEPVDPERYAAFLVGWHELDRGPGSVRRPP